MWKASGSSTASGRTASGGSTGLRTGLGTSKRREKLCQHY